MHVVGTDILAEARGLSEGACIVGLLLGLLLGLTGWWAKRFWVVLGATLGGGFAGLLQGASHDVQPLVAALLLALGGGLLALLLVRFVVYAAVAVASMFLVHLFFPRLDQPVLALLVGGFVGLYLYRFWLMTLTSLLGMLLVVYSGLCLLDALHQLDMMIWATQNADMLDWAGLTMAAVFVLLQFLLDRAHRGKSGTRQQQSGNGDKKRRSDPHEEEHSTPWWGRGWQRLRPAG